MKPLPVSVSKLPSPASSRRNSSTWARRAESIAAIDLDLRERRPEALEQLAQPGAVAQDGESGHPIDLFREFGDQEIELVLALPAQAAFGRGGEVEPHHLG